MICPLIQYLKDRENQWTWLISLLLCSILITWGIIHHHSSCFEDLAWPYHRLERNILNNQPSHLESNLGVMNDEWMD